MVTLDNNEHTERNPVMEIDAAQRRQRWIAYATVLTSSVVMLLMLKWVVERL
jgi:hypothetical protein